MAQHTCSQPLGGSGGGGFKLTTKLSIVLGAVILSGLSLGSTNIFGWEVSQDPSSNSTGGGNITGSAGDNLGAAALVLLLIVIVVPVVLIVAVNLSMKGRE